MLLNMLINERQIILSVGRQQLLSIINIRMNVVRDLRNTITHLEAEVQKKEKFIKQQQQDYEQIILSLQTQNERLKLLLQGDSITHKQDDFLKEESRLRQDSTSKKESPPFIPNPDYVELINENNFLRNEITELSNTYQKQIDQLVFYFEKIKHENKRISPAHYMGQIKTMTNWMQSCIKDFESERAKYERKLMQCGETLDLYQKKIAQLHLQINQLKQQAKEDKEKLKIICRVRL